MVHECLLTRHSDFFRGTLIDPSKEAEDKTVRLEEVESRTFGFFVHWLYNKHLPSKDKGDNTDIVIKFYKGDFPDHAAIVKLYIFGDKFKCPGLQRAAIELLFTDVTTNDYRFPSWREVDLVFEHLQPGDPFCRLLVDFVAIYSHEKTIAMQREEHRNAAFLKLYGNVLSLDSSSVKIWLRWTRSFATTTNTRTMRTQKPARKREDIYTAEQSAESD